MGAVLIVLNLFLDLTPHLQNSEKLNYYEIGTIFSMLCLKPSVHKSEDLQFLLSYIPDKSHVSIANALVSLTNFILGNLKYMKSIKWLNVIPLIHILKKRITPFDTPGRDIQWTDKDIKLHVIKAHKTDSPLRYSVFYFLVLNPYS